MFKTLVTCCCPSEEDRDDDEAGEHTRLIRNGSTHVGNRWSGAYGTPGGSGNRDQRNRPSTTPAYDDQAILAQILHDTANRVIDISTTDAHTVEPREYMERAQKYNQQLHSQITASALQQAATGASALATSPAVGSGGKRTSGTGGAASSGTAAAAVSRCLLSDSSLTASGSGGVSSAEKVLSAPPIGTDDLLTIRQLSAEVGRNVTDIRVEHKEELVVQFAPS